MNYIIYLWPVFSLLVSFMTVKDWMGLPHLSTHRSKYSIIACLINAGTEV
jgi:hypothetical protein